MNLNNKVFKDNRTGEVVKVIDSFENIAILENKTKIDARRLMDPNFFTEQVDPTAFFNNQNAYNSLFEKIKTIPSENIPDDNGEIRPNLGTDNSYRPIEDESAVIYGGSIEDEREELARKYGVSMDNNQSIAKQNEAFARILEDSPEVNELPTTPVARPVDDIEPPIQRVEIDRDNGTITVNGTENTTQTKASKEDPIYTMFRGVKRSVEFSLDLKLENKIPRLDFIEMMEDSYEKSIIDFLADEFMRELLKDPKSLKESIKAKIKDMVYGKPKRVVKKPAPKKPVAKTVAKRPVAKKKIVEPTIEELANNMQDHINKPTPTTTSKRTTKKETEKQ
jgi:hypothetical protein